MNQDKQIEHIQGTGLCMIGDDIDTDQIIPARFMKEVTFENIERYAFYDQRYDSAGNEKPHPFNDKRFSGASILLVNSNFGCGSSREHAPQTLMRHGIRAIIGESFAEIFAGNCGSLGIPLLTLPKEEIQLLQKEVNEAPQTEIIIDIKEKKITVGNRSYLGQLKEEMQKNLLQGTWDTTSVMLSFMNEVQKTYESLPYLQHFAEKTYTHSET